MTDDRVRLTVFLPRWARTGLKQMVAPLGISMSQWVSQMVEKEVIAAGFAPKNLDYDSIAELVTDNFQMLSETTRINSKRLKALRDGVKPTELDLVRLAAAMDIDEDEIIKLYEKTFNKNLENVANGA